MQIAQDFGLTKGAIDSHRAGGHAARALTAMVLSAGNGPLDEMAQIFIANKTNRIRKLDEYLWLIDRQIMSAPKNQAGVAQVDPKLLKVGVEILRSAAQERGEWMPDGGKSAEATTKLAQSIVIHAAVEARKIEQPAIDGKVLKIEEIE